MEKGGNVNADNVLPVPKCKCSDRESGGREGITETAFRIPHCSFIPLKASFNNSLPNVEI
jgi:hypothetical protein